MPESTLSPSQKLWFWPQGLFLYDYSLMVIGREERVNITSMLDRETRREKHLEDARRKMEEGISSR
jgi:hypothetical protein